MSINNISTKAKTMILVLFLFLLLSFIFSYLRYFELTENQTLAENNAISSLNSIFQDEIQKISYFYTNRALANLNSNGIKDSIIKKDYNKLKELSFNRYEVLKKENSHLKSMIFFDKNHQKITKFGKNLNIVLARSNKPYSGFFIENSKLFFGIFSLAFENEIFIGSLAFILDGNFLLKELNQLKNIEAKILLNNEKLPKKYQKNYKFHTINIKNYHQKNIAKLYAIFDLKEQNAKISSLIYSNSIIVLVLFVLIFFILNYGFDVLIKKLELTNKQLLKSQNLLQNINQNLEIKVQTEIEKRMLKETENRKKERLLIHQSKLASMGEMIGNIAHQWRQPLTELGAIFVKIDILNEQESLKKQILAKELEKCDKLINFMSRTIDDFKNFFQKDKLKQEYSINNCIEDTLKIINTALKSHHIKCEVLGEENIYAFGYPRELAQAILNILSNAKDVLIERNIQEPKITIKIFKQNSKKYIIIEDNAKGIKTKPIEKIFEPYFTTKHASSGTGVGLYMSKNIIEKNNLGELNVRNSKFGAVFEIILS